ncbi:MAG: CRTAC1 family protein, partial [Flavobacteriales bacterium]|nr:CRTAC1 family protein [Flavobacteriales bacterium]
MIVYLRSLVIRTLIICSVPTTIKAQRASFQQLTDSESGIDFINTFNVPDSVDPNGFLYLWNGGGVAIGDVNNDGLQDIFFTGNTVPNKLYINLGNLKFKDATSEFQIDKDDPGWNTGVTMADVNMDGWLDIYVCRSQIGDFPSRNLLYINQRGERFEEQAEKYGLGVKDNCTQATFLDSDLDGDLDLYVLTYPKQGAQYSVYQSQYSGGVDQLLVNTNGTYLKHENPNPKVSFGLGVISADFDNNNVPDLYVANDLLSIDQYIRGPVSLMKDDLSNSFDHISFNSMGIDAGDVNNDGLTDLVVLDMLPDDPVRQHMQTFLTSDYQQLLERGGYYRQYVRNVLQLNTGQGFAEAGAQFGIAETDWSWSPLLFDSNNDGNLDLFVSNSLKKDFMNKDLSMFILDTLTRFDKAKQKNRVYKEIIAGLPEFRLKNRLLLGNGLRFTDVSDLIGSGKKINTTGSAYADLDNDGDLDLVLNNLDTTSFILRNTWKEQKQRGHYLRLRLSIKEGGTPAYGASVMSYSGNTRRKFELINSRGFQSCSEAVIHIGIADGQKVDSLLITWPNGLTEL